VPAIAGEQNPQPARLAGEALALMIRPPFTSRMPATPTPAEERKKFLADINAGKEKISITSLDNPDFSVTTHFNPKELEILRATPWVTHNYQDNRAVWRRQDTNVDHEYVGALPRSMTLELLFDRYEAFEDPKDPKAPKPKEIEEIVETLDIMASVTMPSGREEDMRPHQCVVSWGAGSGTSGVRRFRCVIESLTVKYTMFFGNGTPARAVCTLKLGESNSAKLDRKAYDASRKR
jgi:Contractile injection system tube protein